MLVITNEKQWLLSLYCSCRILIGSEGQLKVRSIIRAQFSCPHTETYCFWVIMGYVEHLCGWHCQQRKLVPCPFRMFAKTQRTLKTQNGCRMHLCVCIWMKLSSANFDIHILRYSIPTINTMQSCHLSMLQLILMLMRNWI